MSSNIGDILNRFNYKGFEEETEKEEKVPKSEKNRIKIMSRLMKKGVSERDSSAIMANIGHETDGTYDPSIKQRGVGRVRKEDWFKPSRAGRGTGLLQWDGPRRVELKEYAEEKGKKWDDLDTQTDFIKKELDSTERRGYSKVKKAGSVEDKTKAFSRYVERPGIPHTKARVKIAKEYQDKVIKAKGSYYGGLPKDENLSESEIIDSILEQRKNK